jgi:tetratricopeptide (TPR) repeat protein
MNRLRQLSTLELSRHPDFITGLDAAARNDLGVASDRLRSVIHASPRLLPAVITPLVRLSLQSEDPKAIQLLIADLFSICGWYTEAIQELEEVLEADPHSSIAYQLLSKIWSRAPGHLEIEGIFEAAIDQGIFDSAILDVLPKMYIGRFEYQKSVQLYQKLVNREPTAAHLQSALGNLLAKCQRYDEAIQVLENVVNVSPLHATDIATRLEELVSVAPDNINLREALFRVNCKICRPDIAVRHLTTLIEWHPCHAVRVAQMLSEGSELFPESASIHLALATALVHIQHYSEAITHLHIIFDRPEKHHLTEIQDIAERILLVYPAQVYAMQLLSDMAAHAHDYSLSLDYLEKITQYDYQESSAIRSRIDAIAKAMPDLQPRCHYIIAKLLLQQRNFDQAIVECQLILGTELTIAAQQLAATAYELKNDLEKSESTLFQALQSAPFNPDLHTQLRNLKERFTEHKTTSLTAVDSHSTVSLGIAYLIQSEYYPALEQLQKITPQDPEYIQSQILISRCFLDLGRFDQSLNHLTRLIATPGIITSWANQARYLSCTSQFSLGNINKCIETLESILEYDITFSNTQSMIRLLKQESVLAYRVTAVSGCYNAQQLFVMSVKNSEVSGNQTLSFAHPHNNAGVEYMFKHQMKAAEDEFRLALQMDPNLTVVYCNFALLKLIQHQPDEAMQLLKSAESITPHHDLLHICRGLIATNENRLQEAERQFQAAYAIRADNYITLINLGDIYFQLRELEPAFEFWREAANLAPVPHLIHRRMGYLTPLSRYWQQWSNGLELPLEFPDLSVLRDSV